MAHTDKMRDPASLPVVPAGKVIHFVDVFTKTPSLKLDDQSIVPSATLTGGAVPLDEQGSDPTNVADRGFVYTKDVGGITELFYIDDGGQVIQMTEDGALLGGGGGGDFWPNPSGQAEASVSIGALSSTNFDTTLDLNLPAGVNCIVQLTMFVMALGAAGEAAQERYVLTMAFDSSAQDPVDRFTGLQDMSLMDLLGANTLFAGIGDLTGSEGSIVIQLGDNANVAWDARCVVTLSDVKVI